MDTEINEEYWKHLLEWAEENIEYYIDLNDHIEDFYYDPDLGREDK